MRAPFVGLLLKHCKHRVRQTPISRQHQQRAARHHIVLALQVVTDLAHAAARLIRQTAGVEGQRATIAGRDIPVAWWV
jgi:hypothetical protein